jgi:hypothetical protein
MESLTGLRDMNGNIISNEASPNINSNILFNVSSTTGVPLTCDAIVSTANQSTFDDFLRMYKLFDSTNDPTQRGNDLKTNLSLFYNGLANQNINQGQSMPNNTNILNYLDKVKTSQIPVLQQVHHCLTEASQPDTKELIQQRNETSEAKSRFDFIQNADKNVSYYEGWFPMFRPMTEGALFGLFGASIFLLLLSIAILLQFVGISLDITFPDLGFTEKGTSYIPYIVMGIGLSGTIALLRWYFKSNS